MATDWTESSCSVAELVAQAANQFVSEQLLPGFYYYEEYGAYYNPEIDYFYHPNTSLFYHSASQCYYRLNEQTNEYELWKEETNTGISESAWTKRGFKKRATKLFGKIFVENAAQDEVDVMEITLDLVDKCSFLAGDYCSRKLMKRAFAQTADEEIDGITIKRSNLDKNPLISNCYTSSEEDDDEIDNAYLEQEMERRMAEEESANNAPCIRLVERPKGFLHIVTIMGAKAGFGQPHDIPFKVHENAESNSTSSIFSITYNDSEGKTDGEKGAYQLETSSPLPIFLNAEQITTAKKFILSHEDSIQIGEISFLVHIHSGTNTCHGCEPGLFVKNESSTEKTKIKKRSRNAERLRQMRILKEQYGISNARDADQIKELECKYFDRAKLRRKVVGTYNPTSRKVNSAGGIYTGCSAAPVPGCSVESVLLKCNVKAGNNEPLEDNNKGFQLLKEMGWKEGQGLGKNNQGIQGLIGTTLKNDRAGLGMTKPSAKISIQLNQRQSVMEVTRQRYDQIDKKEKSGTK